jgi:hypothetical protein
MSYGFFPDPSMDEEDRQRLEDLINDEIAKGGLTDRVKVNESAAVLSSVPSWETALNEAVDAGIERFRAGQ